MYAEVAWVLISSGTQVQPQIILDPDYLSVSYDYGCTFDSQMTKIHESLAIATIKIACFYKKTIFSGSASILCNNS